MPTPSVPTPVNMLTDQTLTEMYGHGPFERGLSYAHDGRVTVLGTKPGSLRGIVSGSARNTYIVHVRWFSTDHGIVVEDQCSCPLGGACKHAVALVLTARWATPGLVTPDWRTRLDRIVRDDRDKTPASRLALQITLEIPRSSRWDPHPAARLMARPVRRGQRDRWIKTGASWRDLEHGYSVRGPGLDDTQRRALHALRVACFPGYFADSGAVSLAGVPPEWWFQVGHAVQAGVAVVDAHGTPGAVVVSETPAVLTVDVSGGEDDTVRLTTRLQVDGTDVTVDGTDTGLFGKPAHGLFRLLDGIIHLHQIDPPLDPAITDLLADPPLTVPEADVDELVDLYLPGLARFATVGSRDGTVAFVEKHFTHLRLDITRATATDASFRWSAAYRRGERTSTVPLVHVDVADRGHEAESVAIHALHWPETLPGPWSGPDGTPRDGRVRGVDAVTLLSDVVPWLETQTDVEVVIHGDVPPLRAATADPLISLAVADAPETRDGSTDWFDLQVQVSVDGEPIVFTELFTALSHDDEVLVLPSGTWLRLDRPEFRRLHELIVEARRLVEPVSDDAVRVNRFQVSWWDDLTELGVVASQSARWAADVDTLRNATAPGTVTPSPRLEATLRPYQQEGLDWLGFLHAHRLGGILADDMGLGKTVQTLALCLHLLDDDPTARILVVAPTSVVDNWRAEAARFAPDVGVATVTATEARRGETLADTIGDASIVVTSYALFRLEADAYGTIPWRLLLVDEAQFVKNHRSKTYRSIRALDATVKIAITGTPLENSLMDLWSLLSIVAPGLYPDPKRFDTTYRKPIESGQSPELLATLQRRIAPLMRRRTKDAVLVELPPKVEQTVEIELGARHARIYASQLQRQRQKVLGLVGDVQQNRFEILKSLTVLRQLSLDPGLVDEAHTDVGSAKLDRLVEDLEQVLAEGHRALVFSQFTRFLTRVRSRLDDAGITHTYLDGRTRDRAAAIGRFTEGEVPVFVISLKAGGVGLNLTQADYCFVLDPWWNPAVETQAVDRAHRIGQRNTVVVYRYVASGTIEEKVMALKARKAALFDQVVDADGALSGALDAADIRGLFDLDG